MQSIVAGIFVGGRATRMGGAPKGLLATPAGETIVARWRRLSAELHVAHVLVGAHAAYAHEGLEVLADDPRARGPLAGLLALLERAGSGRAIAVACDMPYVTPELLARLVDADAAAPIVAARRSGRWEPFFARYDAPRVLPLALAHATSGDGRLQTLLDSAGAATLALTDAESELLDDWDTPTDVTRSR